MQNSTILKIVLYGAESTGKTSLARQLAEHYQSSWSKEYLRTYLEEKLAKKVIPKGQNIVEYSEVEEIAKGQIQNEDKAVKEANKVVFFDTNILMSHIYAHYYFGKSPNALKKLVKSRIYDLYLFLENDIAWEADLQRDNPETRNKLSLIFKNELTLRNLAVVAINGNGKERFENCVKEVDKYLNSFKLSLI